MVFPHTPLTTYAGNIFIMSLTTEPVTKILLHSMLVSNSQHIQAAAVLSDTIKMLSYPVFCMFNVDIPPSDPFVYS